MDFHQLVDSMLDTSFKGTLSQPFQKQSEIKKISLKTVQIKGNSGFQVTLHYQNKDIHQNFEMEKLPDYLKELFGKYKQGVFSTENYEYHVLVNGKGKMTILKKGAKKKLEITHNRTKNTVLKEGEPIKFLVELGVMTKGGRVIAAKSHKFKQINRFLEIIEDSMKSLVGKSKITIIDFGCGKSYLTFALYHYLVNVLGIEANITGLDLKADVIQHCEKLARALDYKGLHFEVGKIEGYNSKGAVDMVVALHACDTATDGALAQAVKWDAGVILAVPCCQHELYGQVKSDELSGLLKHGILKERFAALVTDGARASLLETKGYRTQVMEFIDMEHTPKNLLIKAVKTGQNYPKAQSDFKKLKELLSFDIALERLFGN